MKESLKKSWWIIAIFLIIIAAAVAMIFTQGEAVAQADSATGFTRDLYFWFKEHMTYWTITVLMAIESSIIPLPSEVVVPPAAYFALQEGSALNIWLIILFASVGAYLGSAINYGLSMLIGRPILYAFADSRVGRFFRLSSKKLEHAEKYFQEKGAISIFFGRLLPAVRHLISIPAGLSRMNFATFSLFTIAGATIWNFVLAGLGYILYQIVPDDNMLFNQLEHYNHYLKIIGFALLAIAVIYIIHKVKNNKTQNDINSLDHES